MHFGARKARFLSMYVHLQLCTHFFTCENHNFKWSKLNYLNEWKSQAPELGTDRADSLHPAQDMKLYRHTHLLHRYCCLSDSSSLLLFHCIKQKEMNPYESSPDAVGTPFSTGSCGIKKTQLLWHLYGQAHYKFKRYTNAYIHNQINHTFIEVYWLNENDQKGEVYYFWHLALPEKVSK